MERLDYEQWRYILSHLPLEQRVELYRRDRWKPIFDAFPGILLSSEPLVVEWQELEPIPHPMRRVVIYATDPEQAPTAGELIGKLPLVERVVLVLEPGYHEEPPHVELVRGLVDKRDTSYVFLFPLSPVISAKTPCSWALLAGGTHVSPMKFDAVIPGLNVIRTQCSDSDGDGDIAFSGDPMVGAFLIGPHFYSFLEQAELGLVCPIRPPSAANPPLKDKLTLFQTKAISPLAVSRLLCIAMYIDKLRGNTRNLDLAMRILYPVVRRARKTRKHLCAREAKAKLTLEEFRGRLLGLVQRLPPALPGNLRTKSFGYLDVAIPLGDAAWIMAPSFDEDPMSSVHLGKTFARNACSMYMMSAERKKHLEDGTSY